MLVFLGVIGVELVNRSKGYRAAIGFPESVQVGYHSWMLDASEQIACCKDGKAVPRGDMPDDLYDDTLIRLIGKRAERLFGGYAIECSLIAVQPLFMEVKQEPMSLVR